MAAFRRLQMNKHEIFHRIENESQFIYLFSGDLPSSPVGMLCSPGLIQRMGPSLLLLRSSWSCRILWGPQGIVCKYLVNIHFTNGLEL